MSVDERVMLNLKKCSDLFFEHYGFVYNIIISRFQKKPVGPLLEIEKAFSHLMQSIRDFNSGDTEKGERNLDRFRGHIERMLLDMYKIAFLLMIEKANTIRKTCSKVKLVLKIEKLYKDSRDFEINNIGSTVGDSFQVKERILNKYRENLAKAEALLMDFSQEENENP